jgi:nitroimidazol reductase NimA-like FMN-containing flavoprotein (pyridoxamine 5'-phosphate oxidase superfamily)
MTNDNLPHELVELEHHECWAALRSADLGRLAFDVEGRPQIFPVNYVVDQGTVVFRTSSGSHLAAAADGRPVAFEADGRSEDQAWSVVVTGTARVVNDLYESLDAAELPIHPEQGGRKNAIVRITATEVTGRRFPIADGDSWDSSLTSAHRASPE